MNCPHCNTHIDEHPANACFDAWVATDVMDWHKEGKSWCDEDNHVMYSIEYDWDGVTGFDPSKSIAPAWEVVEKLLNHPDQLVYLEFRNTVAEAGWCAPEHIICKRICRAAIKAVQG